MTINTVLAVLIVKDAEVSRPWYEQAFGKAADNVPMPSCSEWQLGPDAWVQVLSDTGTPGASMLTIAVDDLDAHVAELSSRGITTTRLDSGNSKVQLSQAFDPDGNVITFAQDLIGH